MKKPGHSYQILVIPCELKLKNGCFFVLGDMPIIFDQKVKNGNFPPL